MDPSNRTLDSMFTVVDPSQISGFVEDGELQEQERPSKRRNVDPEFQGDESIILDDDDDDEGQAEEGERERVFADEGENAKGKAKEIEESLCHFTSIQSLRRAVKRDGSAGEFLLLMSLFWRKLTVLNRASRDLSTACFRRRCRSISMPFAYPA